MGNIILSEKIINAVIVLGMCIVAYGTYYGIQALNLIIEGVRNV